MTSLKNPDGTSIIPTMVPPAIETPFVPPSLPMATSADAELQANGRPTEDPLKASTSKRPTVGRGWQTEQPRPVERLSSLPPALRRNGTNTSALNEAIWNMPGYDDDSSSSEEEQEQTEKDHRRFSRFAVGNDHYKTKGRVSKNDGRLNISVNETRNRGYLAKTLGATFMKHASSGPAHHKRPIHGDPNDPSHLPEASQIPPPKLNIVVMVIGSRGDIQPFLKIGKVLQEEHGHRVRIATHPAFRDFVQKDSGLEFFSVGGDPAELMSFMVKNPGMIPKMETIRAGEIGRRREQMSEIFEGFWRACINATDDEKDPVNMKMMGANMPFVADVIIANPPCFAHIHCAERLGVPLHLMFTFPYTPTQAFPHPLTNIKQTNVDTGYTNFMSYPLVEMMTWQGLGDLINAFRVDCLGLEPVSTLWAPGQLYRLKVPYTYMWSPGLIPKPKDWGPEIDIAGFVFLDLASTFKPPDDLVKFLEAGEPPVYIGFGSIVVDDPDRFTKLIFKAVKKAGVRALVSKGWGGLGDDNVPDNVYMLENTPHDWLFPKVSAVVHHGGAGTTAIGLKCGKPTFIVPFFGDQPFWGSMVGKAGAGAYPVPYKDLTVENMAESIKTCLTPEAKEAAQKIAKSIELEGDGAKNAVESFHRSLMLRGEHSMRCSILEDRVAVWTLKNTSLRLSALAADILVEKKKISWKQLRLIRHCEWNDFEGPGEPITGITTSITGTITGMAAGVGSIPFRIAKSTKKRKLKVAKKNRPKNLPSNRNGTDGKGNEEMMNGKSADEKRLKTKPSRRLQKKQSRTITKGEAAATDIKAEDFGGKTQRGTPVFHTGKPNENGNDQGEDYAIESAITGGSVVTDGSEQNMGEEYAHDVGIGFEKSGEALARAPMDLALAIAQGFHNAPRLYGDTTVRRPVRITGYKSGFKAAGKEFVFGVYDGVTGIVKQPYQGARDNGPIGFIKGVGMGLTGFVLKDIAAIIGPIAYSMKGIHRELLKGHEPTKFIRKARIIQGQRDLRDCRLHTSPNSEQASVTQNDKPFLKTKAKGKGNSFPMTREEGMVTHGWDVVVQVWKIMQEKRSHGFATGRFAVQREKRIWKDNGAFENVAMAEKALEATRRGESLEEVFAAQREELEMSRQPRRDVVRDIEVKKAVDGGMRDGGLDGVGEAREDEEEKERLGEVEQRRENEAGQLKVAQDGIMMNGAKGLM